MNIKLEKLRYIKVVRQNLPKQYEDWLASLTGPVVFDVEGKIKHKWRVVSVLVHGNEPSGFIAVHRWLLSLDTPYTNVRFIVSSVEAAKQQPLFSTRFVDGVTDLNRSFNSKDTSCEVQTRAASIKQAIAEVKPEAVVDMHNTSGSSPAFCVTTRIDMAVQALASFFCQTVMYTRLKLGSLMEQDFDCPIVTLECGGAKDQIAHEMAYQGLHEFLAVEDIFSGHHLKLVDIVEHPLRLEFNHDYSLIFAEHKDESKDVTLVSDIEQHNMGTTRADCFIGWSNTGIEAFTVRNEQGDVQSSHLLYCEEGKLYTVHPMRIFMATSNLEIAKKDCLFYGFCVDEA